MWFGQNINRIKVVKDINYKIGIRILKQINKISMTMTIDMNIIRKQFGKLLYVPPPPLFPTKQVKARAPKLNKII